MDKMSLNIQNKNFLGLLHKLDIDLAQFPDKTFDGLFYNTPESINNFLNWFMENITPDNTLTQLEQAMYFELEKNKLLPSEEVVNSVLSTCDFTFEELYSLNINHVDSLSEELSCLKSDNEELNKISSKIDSIHNEIKAKQNNLKEELNIWKKKLNDTKHKYNNVNALYASKLDEAKELLSATPSLEMDLNSYDLSNSEEKELLHKLEKSEFFENKEDESEILNLLHQQEEDLACVESYLFYSQGRLKEKKARIAVLNQQLQKSISQNSFNNSFNYNDSQYYISDVKNDNGKIVKDVQLLEKEIYNKAKVLSNFEVEKISSHYFSQKTDVLNIFISNLTTCRDYVKVIDLLNLLLFEMLNGFVLSIENILQIRKDLIFALKDEEKRSKNDMSKFEMKTRSFKEISMRTKQHPLVTSLKNIFKLDESLSNEETFKTIPEALSLEDDSCNVVSNKLRSQIQLKVKSILDNTLCGPTRQLSFIPIDLYFKYQNCEQREAELSHKIKRLVNKYVEVKESVATSDRRKLLLWIDFLTNPEKLLAQIKN